MARSRGAAALYDSEERLRLVLDKARDAFVAMDTEGIIIDWELRHGVLLRLVGCRAVGGG